MKTVNESRVCRKAARALVALRIAEESVGRDRLRTDTFEKLLAAFRLHLVRVKSTAIITRFPARGSRLAEVAVSVGLPFAVERFFAASEVVEDLLGSDTDSRVAADVCAYILASAGSTDAAEQIAQSLPVLGDDGAHIYVDLLRSMAVHATATADTWSSLIPRDVAADQSLATVLLPVARGLRERGLYRPATHWFRLAISIAGIQEDLDAAASAWGGFGVLLHRRGQLGNARRVLRRADSVAQRAGRLESRARVLHDTAVLEADAENLSLALGLSALAKAAYGPHHPSTPTLEHDTARIYVDLGRFEEGLTRLRAVLPSLGDRHREAVGWANVARACAGMGDKAGYDAARGEALHRLRGRPRSGITATALLNLAKGAAMLREGGVAAVVAERSARVARRFGEGLVLMHAEAVRNAADRAPAKNWPGAAAMGGGSAGNEHNVSGAEAAGAGGHTPVGGGVGPVGPQLRVRAA